MGDHGEHDAEVVIALLPEPLEGLDLEPELVGRLEIPPDAAPPEHGIVLDGLVLAACHVPELVGRCIECPYPDGFSIECIKNGLNSPVELLDELFFPVVGDKPSRSLVQAEDQVLDPEQPDPVGSRCSSPCCGLGH